MLVSRRGLVRLGQWSLLNMTNARLASRSMMTSNPFLDQEGLPRFEAMRAPETITKYLADAVTSSLTEMQTEFADLENKIRDDDTATASVIMEELERVSAKLLYVWGVAGHLNSVRPS